MTVGFSEGNDAERNLSKLGKYSRAHQWWDRGCLAPLALLRIFHI